MSEPIIIETPAPPTRERLVLVPPGTVSPTYGERGTVLTIHTDDARDATPADLERGGYVPLAAFVGPLDLLSPPTLAGALEAIHSVREAVATAYDREADELRERLETAERELSAATIRADEWKAAAIKAEADLGASENGRAETDELLAAETARAEKAEASLTGLHASAESRGMTVREAARARCALGGPDAQALEGALVQAERELEDAESRAAHMLTVIRERDEARAELARLTALDRATDDELVDLYRKIYETHGGGTISVSHDDCRRAGLLAVAARVRQERCLVAEAVGMGADVRIEETPRNYGANFDGWTVSISTRGGPGVTFDATHVPTADVPATLARLLGEVSR